MRVDPIRVLLNGVPITDPNVEAKVREGMAHLTWACHVCGEERPDGKISVHKVQADSKGLYLDVVVDAEWTCNVRYCNDRMDCAEGAERVGRTWLSPHLKRSLGDQTMPENDSNELKEAVEEEVAKREEMRATIEAAPYPCEGDPIWDRYHRVSVEDALAGNKEEVDKGMDGYEAAANALARAMLIVAEEDPLKYLGPEVTDPVNNPALWEATKERFPGLDRWIGGATGFQFGWAHNAVRYILGYMNTGNPAIITIGTEDEDG